MKPHGPPFRAKAKIGRGNVREIVEGPGKFGEVELNWEVLATEGKFQTQRYSVTNKEMVEENGMRGLCGNIETL